MVQLRNKKCSEVGPKRRCSDPEQYQYLFWYYHYHIALLFLSSDVHFTFLKRVEE